MSTGPHHCKCKLNASGKDDSGRILVTMYDNVEEELLRHTTSELHAMTSQDGHTDPTHGTSKVHPYDPTTEGDEPSKAEGEECKTMGSTDTRKETLRIKESKDKKKDLAATSVLPNNPLKKLKLKAT